MPSKLKILLFMLISTVTLFYLIAKNKQSLVSVRQSISVLVMCDLVSKKIKIHKSLTCFVRCYSYSQKGNPVGRASYMSKCVFPECFSLFNFVIESSNSCPHSKEKMFFSFSGF